MTSIHITLPFPPKELNPNWRGHWSVKAKAVKGYRAHAWAATKQACGKAGLHYPQWKRAMSRVTFYAKTPNRRDRDNLAAMLKPVWDGAADADLLLNDSGLGHYPAGLELDPANPRVEITIEKV